jgi:acyl-CoA thioester hydrolase
MSVTDYIHSTEFSVRDYECDIQGVVNNANYLHYLEHARHMLLISKGIDFSKLHEAGVDLVVTRVEINYKYPLRSRDKFMIRTGILREGNARLAFIQDIFRLPDEKLIALAKVTGVATKKGKPVSPRSIIDLLDLKFVSNIDL